MSKPLSGNMRAWIWAGAALVAVGGVALLVAKDRIGEPAESYLYDVSEYEKTPPELVLFAEREPIEPDIPKLSALAFSPDGRICVAGENALVFYDENGSEIARYSIEGHPDCVAISADGSLFLGMDDHVTALDAEGQPRATWDSLGERAYITSIAVAGEDVYVADAGNREVIRYDRDGRVQERIGKKDPERGVPGLVVPSPYLDLAFDPDGRVWVVNPGRHGFENYRPNGDLVSSWYRPSMDLEGFCGCCNPGHIAFRPDGTLVTAEKGIVRVKLYTRDESFMGLVAGPDAFRAGPTGPFAEELEPPIADLAVDKRGRVLVLDKQRNAVRVFEEKEPA